MHCVMTSPPSMGPLWLLLMYLYIFILKEKNIQSKRMLRLVDDDIESPYKIVPDIFDFFFIKLWALLWRHMGSTWVQHYLRETIRRHRAAPDSVSGIDWIKFSQWNIHEIVDNERVLTCGVGYLMYRIIINIDQQLSLVYITIYLFN